MIPAEFHQDIYARLNGDTGSGGLRNSGSPLVTQIRNTFADEAESVAFPYVVFNVVSSEQADAFNTSAAWVMYDVHTFFREQDPSGSNSFALGMAVVKRIRGNWESAAVNRVPDYGLDRWQPTLTGSGWSSSVCVSEGYQELHGSPDGVLHWVQSFRCLISKAGA